MGSMWGPCSHIWGVWGCACCRWPEPGPSPVLAVTQPAAPCLTPAPRTHPQPFLNHFSGAIPEKPAAGALPRPCSSPGLCQPCPPPAGCGHGAVGSVPLRGALAGCGLAKHFGAALCPCRGN